MSLGDDPMGTWAVAVTSHGLNEKGWMTMADVLQDVDLETVLDEAATEAIRNLLPREFDGEWMVRVRELVAGDVIRYTKEGA